MLNWSTDEKTFKKKYPKEYKLWRLVQLINYGLDGEKLDEKEVKLAWLKIKDRLDPYKARYFEFLLWNKYPRLPKNISFRDWYTNKPIKNLIDQSFNIEKGEDGYELISEYGRNFGLYKTLTEAKNKYYQIQLFKNLSRQ